MNDSIWGNIIRPVLSGRNVKPRTCGITMVLDKGLGLRATSDLMDTAGAYIDIVKFTFGTSALYDAKYLEKKMELLRACGIEVMPGGTLTEIAIYEGVYRDYLRKAKQSGFTHIEISDGTIQMSRAARRSYIALAAEAGFHVSTEVGTKDLSNPKAVGEMNRDLRQDLADGASFVVIEAKEAGRNSTIYDENGLVKEEAVARLLDGVTEPEHILWEAPLRDQQDYLIDRFGPNVNIGNCPPEGVLSLETLRYGLGDTPFRKAWQRKGAESHV